MRSLIKVIPTTSSSSLRMGRREKPCSIATSMAWVKVNVWGIVTMSGNGTITSRATVSPNSMIDSIRSRSSSSMTSSFIAASTIPSSSCSLTNGPCSRPFPFTMTLVNEMSHPETIFNGGNDTSSFVPRAVLKAARSGYSKAYVFGTASARTKKTMTFKRTPTATPSGPKARDATTPVKVA